MSIYQSAFTVDVEDGINISMRDFFGVQMDPTDRVVKNTHKILEMLDNLGGKGTFFVLGQIGEHFPDLVREIHSNGHEIGVHGYNHLEFTKMDEKQALNELNRAKKLLEDLIGDQIFGHRAPAFSINQKTSWALDVVHEAGFTYDSSIIPIKSSRYGWPGQNKNISVIQTPYGNQLIEAPVSVNSLFGFEKPVAGGRYLQFLPAFYLRQSMMNVIKERPVITYLHPYDIDDERYPDYYFDELDKYGYLRRLRADIVFGTRKKSRKKLLYVLNGIELSPLKDIIEDEIQVDLNELVQGSEKRIAPKFDRL